jgi:hypothetical protein
MIVNEKVYFRRDSDQNWGLIDALKAKAGGSLAQQAIDNIVTLGYEIEVTVEIDLETGKCVATHLDGAELEFPKDI